VSSVIRLVILYTVFALVSIAVNIGSQALAIGLYKGVFAVQLSVLVGTAAGLPVKYVLDKRYIFGFKSNSLVHDGQVFMVYILMGVFTTALFWTVEYGFDVGI